MAIDTTRPCLVLPVGIAVNVQGATLPSGRVLDVGLVERAGVVQRRAAFQAAFTRADIVFVYERLRAAGVLGQIPHHVFQDDLPENWRWKDADRPVVPA